MAQNDNVRSIVITLPDQPESLNTQLRQHWAARARANKGLQNEVFVKAYKAGWRRDWPMFTKVEVVIVNWRGDFDNAVAGTKPICDALWRNDLIKDDNPKNCAITYRLEKSEEKGKSVRITMSYEK